MFALILPLVFQQLQHLSEGNNSEYYHLLGTRLAKESMLKVEEFQAETSLF